MSKPRLSNPAPVAAPATDAPALLFITLEAAPGVGALRKARAAIAHMVLWSALFKWSSINVSA